MQKVSTCIWFEDDAEEAANFYKSIFKDFKILDTTRYDEESSKVSGRKAGSVMTIKFRIGKFEIMALNGGKVPGFEINSAISFVVECANQKEIDHLWTNLQKDGGREQQCGWLSDKYGVTWQIIPKNLNKIIFNKNPEKTKKILNAMYQMVKLDIAKLKEAGK